jgi:hypothetical protein
MAASRLSPPCRAVLGLDAFESAEVWALQGAMAEELARFHLARFLGYEAAGAGTADLSATDSRSGQSPGFAPAPRVSPSTALGQDGS